MLSVKNAKNANRLDISRYLLLREKQSYMTIDLFFSAQLLTFIFLLFCLIWRKKEKKMNDARNSGKKNRPNYYYNVFTISFSSFFI